MNNEVSIVVADDHPILLKGFADELASNHFNVVGRAVNGAQALTLIVEKQPTIAFIDIEMPKLNGLEVIRMAKIKGSFTKFVLFSFHKESDYILQAKSLHIDGYILKEDTFAEVRRCIRKVLNGQRYYSPSFENNALFSAEEEMTNINLLTTSEKMILKLIADQTSTQEIAISLGVSTRTIEKHRSNIIRKLGLDKSPNALTNWALINNQLIQNI